MDPGRGLFSSDDKEPGELPISLWFMRLGHAGVAQSIGNFKLCKLNGPVEIEQMVCTTRFITCKLGGAGGVKTSHYFSKAMPLNRISHDQKTLHFSFDFLSIHNKTSLGKQN